ncbi:hypothetical protein Tco_0399535, partial [Tanacetum coccineum]
QFVPQAVRLRSGKVSIPAARPNQVPASWPKPVSTGRPKLVSTSAPVSTGKQYRPPPVHAGRKNSSSVTSDLMFITIKCSMMGMDGQVLLSPQQVVLGRHIEIKYTG